MKLKFIFLLLLIFPSLLDGQQSSYRDQWQLAPYDSSQLVNHDQQMELLASESEMEWYKDAKFGIFVHWGPALHVTDVLSWGRFGERPGAGKAATNGVVPEIYDQQFLQFNPTAFDAELWMEQIKAFGASYLVFTAKHHDGFCLFDASNTEYDIMSSPYGKDICKELANAANKHGIKLFWYYSQPDWKHPDCLRENHYTHYLPYMKEQVRQLYSDYGRIHGIFWDGLGSKYWHWDSYSLMKEMKALQPGLISNPRAGFGWPDNNCRGDFDTPEQSIGPINHHRYWEACITMRDKWLFSPKGPVKNAEGILSMLISIAGNGGNLLLNLGPDGLGNFVQEETQELVKVGAWLEKYGHTIYGSRRGPYICGDWGVSTRKNNKIYLHFTQKLTSQALPVFKLPALDQDIKSARSISPGLLKMEKLRDSLVFIFDKKEYIKNIDNIIELEYVDDLKDSHRIYTWEDKAIHSNLFDVEVSSWKNDKHHPAIIFRNKEKLFSEGIKIKSWWQASDEDKNPTITLYLKEAKKIKTVILSEHIRWHSIEQFTLETLDKSGHWSNIYNGSVVGESLKLKLGPEEILGLKLKILKSKSSIRLSAFNLYE